MKSQATRSRDQNRKIARKLLAEKLEVLEKGVGSRKMMKEEVKSKKKRSKEKKARRKYRKLAEEKTGAVGTGAADEDGDDGGEDVDNNQDDEGDSREPAVLQADSRAQAETLPTTLGSVKKNED
jgi:protein subunit release factor B